MLSRLLAGLLLLMATTGAGCGDDEPLAPTPPAPFAVRAILPTTGLPGQTVSIFGSGFQPRATVTFGGLPTGSNVVTNERISTTVPTLPAGTVDVVVQNPDGNRGTLAGAFSIEAVSIGTPSPRSSAPT